MKPEKDFFQLVKEGAQFTSNTKTNELFINFCIFLSTLLNNKTR